jgi:putative MATE family efflux protein
MPSKSPLTYRQIWLISLPLILGSAGQNIVALSDSMFLYYYDKDDFAAIGFVGVFYLIIAAIGYGFSKGGQVLIARRMGEGKPEEVGRNFFDMLYFELALAVVMFLFMQFVCPSFFKLFVKDPDILRRSLEFLTYRSWGVFFSYSGLAIIALYTGVARTTFILIDTAILFVVNVVLCLGLIYGKFGLPEMGIAGAGLASTIAEGVALIVFIIYMFFDKKASEYHLFKPRKVDFNIIREQLRIGIPSVAQPVVGLGSWFVFFAFVENHLGKHALAVTNLVRVVYLCLSIPIWGFASSINTLVSYVIGQKDFDFVMPTIWKTAKLCLAVTMAISLPVLLFPEQSLSGLLQRTGDFHLLTDAIPILQILILILAVFSVGGVFFNALASTGAAGMGLGLQFVCAVFYLAYIYVVLSFTEGGLTWAWMGELFYWGIILAVTIWYLRSNRWHSLVSNPAPSV